MNIAAFAISIVLFVIVFAVSAKTDIDGSTYSRSLFIGALAALLALFPHEIIRALCFKGDVYLYTNLKQGMLFVVGPEDMTGARFVMMSLAPNIVFGFLPLALFFIFPEAIIPGVFGAISIGCGAADYMNVFNALTQMPGARLHIYTVCTPTGTSPKIKKGPRK